MNNKLTSPYTGGEVTKITQRVTITFQGEDFELDLPGYQCVETQRVFATGEMNDNMALRVQDLWREKHKVPTIEQLKNLRKRLGLNKKQMSLFLNLGVNQYRYYESGEIPKGAALFILQAAVKDDFSLSHLLSLKTDILPENTVKALEGFLNGIFDNINIENTPVVIEATPKVNKSVPTFSSEQGFDEYQLSGKAINKSDLSLA